ncbi:hypothetical protein A7U60_g2636 [Sanghuangporus baumii]|uniref:Uncharacterized protein n=1 Tax=Sanghuangporus baumii TaxID=108892 RepID=A0A9Q5I205_SANBA|nr:hypothetical protein A7U60_g2636 [Sanghuangporus baumii]
MTTLPVAQKVISDRPPKNSVASPTVQSEQEADVDRKMRLYGVIRAFRNGRMPDNNQIDETLLYVRDHSPINVEELSDDGKQLVHDTRALIDTARKFVAEKNADEVVQQFLYRTSGAAVKEKKPNTKAPVSEKETKEDSKKAGEHLRTLFKLLISNSETRKLLSDAKILGRSIFADAASNVAERSRPRKEDVEKVDQAAPPHEFQEGTMGNDSSAIPQAARTGESTKMTEDTSPGTRRPAQAPSPATNVSQDVSSKKIAKSRFQDISARVPEKHRKVASNEVNNAKGYLQKQFPKERQDQLVHRLKKVVVECQEHQDYQESISWLISQLEKYFGHGKRITTSGASQTSASFFEDPTISQAASEMRTFLERLADGRSMEGMFSAARNMQKDAETDEELREWWTRVDSFARRALLESGFVLKPEFESQAHQLHAESRKFFDAKYKSHLDGLLDAIQTWFRGWSEDPFNKRLGEDATKLTKDLLFNSEGGLAFKSHLLTDIRKVILPALIEKIGYIPIPRVEFVNKNIDVVIENLTLQGRNFLPKIFEINVQNYVKFSPYKEIGDEHHHEFTLTLSQIQADIRDVAFYFRSKKGLSMNDTGLADVLLGGKGITIKARLSSNTMERENGHLFTVKNVKVSVDTLKFAVRDSKHDFLYRIVSKIGTGIIKRAVSKAISDAVRTGLESADIKLVDIRSRMADADESEDSSKMKVLKDLRSKRENGEKETSKDSQFRIMPEQNSMLLPDQGHKTGWVRKQFDRDAAAAEGEGWRSRAFSIVSGSK